MEARMRGVSRSCPRFHEAPRATSCKSLTEVDGTFVEDPRAFDAKNSILTAFGALTEDVGRSDKERPHLSPTCARYEGFWI